MDTSLRTCARLKSPTWLRSRYFVALVLLGVLLALIWIMAGGTAIGQANLAGETPSQAESAMSLTPQDVARLLLRSGTTAGGVDLDILYAPTWYYRWSQRALPESDVPVLAFFVLETIHVGELGPDRPAPLLQIGDTRLAAIDSRVVSDAPHHRVSQLLFPAVNDSGEPLITEDSRRLVVVTPQGGTVSWSNTYEWELPLPHGLGIVNGGEGATLTSSATNTPRLTWPAFVAIMGGMLTALSPCLLQLAAYYAAVLAGAGSVPGQLVQARKHLVRTGIFFVGGFALIYTAGGAAAGFVGGSLQQLTALQQWSRPGSVIAGIIIIALAVRVAVRARAPLVCRLPLRARKTAGDNWLSSGLMGATFAFGCLSCFSATVLSALLLYAGSTGSPVVGALLLLLFSAGVGTVFVVAAGVVGRAAPLMGWLTRAQPLIGGVSALTMAAFGLLMVTYKFHVVSGYLFRLVAPG